MPTEIAGVMVVMVVIGLVEVAKRMGMDTKWSPMLAIGLGLLVMVGNQATKVVPTFTDWYNTILWGVAIGLMAVGLYSGAKNTGEGLKGE